MIDKRLLYYKTKDGYTNDVSNISPESIVFIGEDTTVRTHNKVFGEKLKADEDNFTVIDGVLTTKDRTSDDGRGYVVLKKDDDIIESIVSPNTTYVIKYDYKLKRGINLPKNVTLKFEGGSLTGLANEAGIVGHGTYIDAPTDHKIFNNILVGGDFYNRYFPIEWFGFYRGTVAHVNSFNLKGTVSSVDDLPENPADYDAYAIKHDVYVYISGRGWVQNKDVISSKALDMAAAKVPKSLTITGTSVEYATSDDGENAPATGWSKAIVAVSKDFPYMWTRTIVNYSDGTSTTAYSVSYSGIDGKDASIFTMKGSAVAHYATTDELFASNLPQIAGETIYLVDESPTHITVVTNGNVMSAQDRVANNGDAYVITTTDNSGITVDEVWVATDNGWFKMSSINNNPGIDGASIDRTIQYWALSDTPNCPSSDQFSKTRPMMTPEKPYLWCYSIFYLTNGRSIGGYESAYLAGVYGKTGQDGDTCTPIYYFLLSNKNSGVTRNDAGWTINSAQSPTESNKYLWCYIELKWGKQASTYVEPFIIAQYGIRGHSGPIAYLAGSWSSTATYVRKDTVPVVYSGGKYWYLNQEGSFKGKIPGQDSVWSELEKYQVLFTDMLIANAGTINDAVFWDGFMFSKQGTVNGNTVSATDANQSWRQFNPKHPTESIKFTDGEFVGKYNFIPNLCLNFTTGQLVCNDAVLSGLMINQPVTVTDSNIKDYWYVKDAVNQTLKYGTIPAYCKMSCDTYSTLTLPKITGSSEQKNIVRSYYGKSLRIDNVGSKNITIADSMWRNTISSESFSTQVVVEPGWSIIMEPHYSQHPTVYNEGYDWTYVKFQTA